MNSRASESIKPHDGNGAWTPKPKNDSEASRMIALAISTVATTKRGSRTLVVTEQAIDTSTAEGRLFFNMLGSIAEFETELRKARQRDGIDAALAKGPDSPFRGRPQTIEADMVAALKAEGLTPSAIAKKMGIARSSVYRMLDQIKISTNIDAGTV